MLDAMLDASDAQQLTQYAEEACQLMRIHITKQQGTHAQRYNIRHRQVEYQSGDQIWVWTQIHRQGLSEKLPSQYSEPYKVLCHVSEVNYEVIPDGATLPRF